MSHASSSVRTSSKRFPRAWWIAGLVASCVHAAPTLQNSRYTLTVRDDGSIVLAARGIPDQLLQPDFIVLTSARDPGYHRNHLNYPLAPRTAIRWAA